MSYLAQPDAWFFTRHLHQELKLAAAHVLPFLGPAADREVCLVENATVATVTLARRWALRLEAEDVIVVLDVVYQASHNVLREPLGRPQEMPALRMTT